MADVRCVGALIRNARNQVFVHHRTATRRLLPDTWDIVGGHVEAGESPREALAREVEEETGWRLRRVEAVVADWEWQLDGDVSRREVDYLVEVTGDLAAPRLEQGKHDASAWVGADDLELLMVGRTDGDRRLRDIVAKAVRLRLTDRLRLDPIGPEHAGDLYRLHEHPEVAEWYGHPWTAAEAEERAATFGREWARDGVQKWIAYDCGTGDLVGRGGLSYVELDGRRQLEVGWVVQPRLWGQGYAQEIGRAGLRFAFDDLRADEVIAFTERHNHRSQAVMDRLGMRYAGELRRRGLVEGREGEHDDAPFVRYVIDRATWAAAADLSG
ncbi:MAG: GNAT family N-acetyltransferase [Streptosporangiales bacterium]|nr:GNAT family N-acetyltransferase [Streptosporangiales bacterium]